MSVLTAVLLGLVQGIAEFLPISSSGHLAIAEHLLNMQGASNVPDFFDVLLHLGTLFAVFAAYWDDIRDMVVEFFTGIGDLAHHRTPNPVPPALCETVKAEVFPSQVKRSDALRAGPGFSAKVTSISEYPAGPSSAERVSQSGFSS